MERKPREGNMRTESRSAALTRTNAILLGLAMTVCLALTLPSLASAAKECPANLNLSKFTGKAGLKKLNASEWRFGQRPTGSPNQNEFISWLEKRVKAFPGIRTRSLPYRVNRWRSRSTTLRVSGKKLPVAGPIPYSRPTGKAGASAPVSYVPLGESITPENAAGRIVLRHLPLGKVPYGVFMPGALGVSLFDPGNTLDPMADYEREFLTPVVPDIEAAESAGAAGLMFYFDLPRDQVKGFYAPYEGLQWKLPAAYLGVDEGQKIVDSLADGGSVNATLTVRARRAPARTRTLLATLPGRSKQRIVVESHTDGVNAIWDNGPIAMLAMAKYLSSLPRHCRERTVQFAFVTGHLYQRLVSKDVRDGGAEQLAARLDRQYDQGKVAGVVVLEHLGAREYLPVPRSGKPGFRLKKSGRHELLLVPVTESEPLRDEVTRLAARYRLDRTAVIIGADVPEPDRVPVNCSFGGEGTPYNHHLLPTVAAIAAPNVLFNPAFGLGAIDFRHMRRQSMAFTELVREMSGMKRNEIAGNITAQRIARAEGAPGCES